MHRKLPSFAALALFAVAVGLVVGAMGCSRGDVKTAANAAGNPWPPALLKQAGFVEVPLHVGKTRLFELDVEVSGEKLLFLLDTGASYLVLDCKVAERMKLATKKAPGQVGGLGTADAATQVARLESLRVGEFDSVPFETLVMDLAAVNESRVHEGDRPCHGLIGAAFLDYHHAVVDYPARKLYLKSKKEERPAN
jgi:predicted aspartyl protease